MSWKAIIIDDEKGARENLNGYLSEHCPELLICGQAENVKTAITLINRTQPDLVFLDVEMPGGNGFDLLSQLPKIEFDVVFTTAYGHYAVDAIRFAALDYLQKPIDAEELQAAVNRFISSKNSAIKSNLEQFNALLSNIKTTQNTNFQLIVPEVSGFTLINSDDVLYLHADKHYTHLHLRNGSKITSSKNIGHYEEMLPSNAFYRINQSYIVKLSDIQKYRKGEGGTIAMSDGYEIDVPRRKKAEFLRFFE